MSNIQTSIANLRSSISGAMNHIDGKIGDLSVLETADKSSAIAAINDLKKTGSIESGFFAHYEYFESVTDPNALFVEGGIIGADTVLQAGDRVFVSNSASDYFGHIYTVSGNGNLPSANSILSDKFVIQIDRSYLYEYTLIEQSGMVTKTDYSRNGYYYINRKGNSFYNKKIQLSTKNSKEVSYRDQTVEQGLDDLRDTKLDRVYINDGGQSYQTLASKNNDTGILSGVIVGGGRTGSRLVDAGDIIYELVAIGSDHDYHSASGGYSGIEAGKLVFKSVSDWSTSDQRASLEVQTSGADGMQTRFIVDDAGSIEVVTPGQGVIMASPNGTRYKLQVDDSGNLTTSAV